MRVIFGHFGVLGPAPLRHVGSVRVQLSTLMLWTHHPRCSGHDAYLRQLRSVSVLSVNDLIPFSRKQRIQKLLSSARAIHFLLFSQIFPSKSKTLSKTHIYQIPVWHGYTVLRVSRHFAKSTDRRRHWVGWMGRSACYMSESWLWRGFFEKISGALVPVGFGWALRR